jgi:RimJ/RimL family protein N-acetyltransferase
MSWLAPAVLRDEYVALEPLSQTHLADLIESATDGELWKLWYTTVPQPENVSAEIDRRLRLAAEGSMQPFAVIDRSIGRAVGMTTYMHIDRINQRLEIGSTWYRKAVQRTPLNTHCKLLLLTHAFEDAGCLAVEFRTHFFNHQSRRAIERLGAKLDGVLRQHQRGADGAIRDTCVYSIIAGEWPAVRSHLRWLLAR